MPMLIIPDERAQLWLESLSRASVVIVPIGLSGLVRSGDSSLSRCLESFLQVEVFCEYCFICQANRKVGMPASQEVQGLLVSRPLDSIVNLQSNFRDELVPDP